MKKCYILLSLILLSCVVFSQETRIQAYQEELKKEKIDTSRIHLIGDLARLLIMNSDTAEALKWLNEGLVLCKKQNYDYGFGHIYNGFGIYYLETSRLSQAKPYFQMSYEYNKKSKKDTAPLGAATALGNLSLIAESEHDIESAVNLKLQALDIWKASPFSERYIAVGNLYISIGTLYSKENQFDKAIYYNKKGIETRLNADLRDSDLATSYVFLMNNFIRSNQLDSASKYVSIIESLVNEIKSPTLYMRYYGSMGELEFERKNFEKALSYNQSMLDYAKQAQRKVNEISAYLNIAKCYQQLKQPAQALPYFKEALIMSEKANRIEGRKSAMQGLADTYHQLKNDTEAFRYLSQYNVLKDSIIAEETKVKLNEIDTKYQAAQKEKQILVLEKESRHQDTLIYGLLGGLAALVLIGGLIYRNLSSQQKIAKQQTILKEKEIQQLQQERQLVATNSILKGQEEERTRVARDLHDGLGGLLTSIKLTLSKVKGNFILPEASVGVFARALEQLDNAISEMRRVAHSMMPETLVRYGLPDALKDFCDDINETGKINIHLQLLGMEKRLESSVEVVIYRIIQELLNNILKHAEASDAYLQLALNQSGIISLTVEDNGQGFNLAQLEHNKGAGMRNIENRVAYLGGKINIQSQPNDGTSVLIEIPV